MELLRVAREQTWQRVRPLRLTQTGPQRVLIQRPRIPSPRPLTTRAQTRSLRTQRHIAFTRCRNLLRPFRQPSRRFASAAEDSAQPLSLSQRMKKLSREYGWSALGVYLLLSALDFPFCFLAVRLLGTDRIGHWEHVVVSTVKEWIPWPQSGETHQKVEALAQEGYPLLEEKPPAEASKTQEQKRLLDDATDYEVIDHGYKEAEEANRRSDASLWTQLVLAYAIHKSFIFIRVPLTAAVTPKVVKTLRSWGYNIGKRPTKPNAAGH